MGSERKEKPQQDFAAEQEVRLGDLDLKVQRERWRFTANILVSQTLQDFIIREGWRKST